jgi:transposase
LVGALESQIRQNTRLVNQLHNRLARVFPELAVLVSDMAAVWVLRLLLKYPSASKIAAARRTSLLAIPYLTEEMADKVQTLARQTVASSQGELVEELIRQSVQAVRLSQKSTAHLKALVGKAFDALPAGPHRHVESIPGIGKLTAAVFTAKVINLDRFKTPESLVNYFGVFPEENTSGVDKYGRPVPPGTMRMCRKGNDLVRRYLWNAAKSAVVHNPVVRTFFVRKRSAGKRGDVALGHCMQKLLHLIFAVWKKDQPFAPPQTPTADQTVTPASETEKAVGRKGQSPVEQAVTTAPASITPPEPVGNTPAQPHNRPTNKQPVTNFPVNFAELRRQITIEQVLRQLGWWECLRGKGDQLRGPCPLHASSDKRRRSFSVNLHKNAFQCFDADCAAHGNALDLWAQKNNLPLVEAAQDLAQRFGLLPGTEKRNP